MAYGNHLIFCLYLQLFSKNLPLSLLLLPMLDAYLPRTDRWRILAATVPVALSSGTLFVYSVYGTQLADKCGLDSSLAANLNISATVGTSVGGLLGGYITDMYGTQIPVFSSLVFVGLGYKWLHWLYGQGMDAPAWQLIVAMFLVGIGSTSSYFASIKAVTVMFPQYKGSAQSVTIASFAISSLLYSFVYSSVFKGDVGRFLLFLSLSSLVMQFIGVLFVRVDGHKTDRPDVQGPELNHGPEFDHLIHERLPLVLASSSSVNLPSLAEDDKPDGLTLKLLDVKHSLVHPIFIFHFVVMAIMQGIGQMYIYSVGFVIKALHYEFSHLPEAQGVPSLHSIQALHVSLIAIFSFVGRLASGPLADTIVNRFKGHRQWVTILGALIMFLGQFALSFPIDKWSNQLSTVNTILSVISCFIGFAYGLTFTTFPGIVADLFSLKIYSLIWGIMYSSTVPGLTIFTKVFGYIYDENSVFVGGDLVCAKGSRCYLETFELTSSLCVVVAGSLLVYLYIASRKKGN